MKKRLTCALLVIVMILSAVSLVACGNKVDPVGIWENATYLDDEEFGRGDTTITVEVKAGESSVLFTINTDKTILADALLEHELVAGEYSEYGLAVYTINGMTANWNVDGGYWAPYVGDEYAMGGVSYIEIKNGDSFRFELETM